MNIVGAQGNVSNIDFAALKLRAGTRLQLQGIEGGSQKLEVEFAAALQGRSIFVAMSDNASGNVPLKVGERYQVRGFNGVSDFAFNSSVMEIQTSPFMHAHLMYPESVESRVVREELRVKTSLPATVVTNDGVSLIPVSVGDLCIAGALIESATPLGGTDDLVEIRLPTRFDSKETELRIPAKIRHMEDSGTTGAFRSGVEFVDIARDDKLVLYYLLFTLAGSGR